MKTGVFTVGVPDPTPEEAAREIKDAGYEGWFVIEDFSAARPSIEALRRNLAFVQKFIGSAVGSAARHS